MPEQTVKALVKVVKESFDPAQTICQAKIISLEQASLKGLNAFCRISAAFGKEDYFSDFLLAFLSIKTNLKEPKKKKKKKKKKKNEFAPLPLFARATKTKFASTESVYILFIVI